MIDRVQWSTGLATGGVAVATSTGHSSHVSGLVLAVHVDYQDAPPAGTCDFTLSDEGDPISELIVNLANQATDIKIYPRRVTEQNDGTDIEYEANLDVHEPYVVHGRLEAIIAQANDDDYCVVTVWIQTDTFS
jgi:hypothetical protein